MFGPRNLSWLWQWCHSHQILMWRVGNLHWGKMFQTWTLFLWIPWCVWMSGSLWSVSDSFSKPFILFLVLFIMSLIICMFFPVHCSLLCPDHLHFNFFCISRRFNYEHRERAAHTPRGLPIHSANLVAQLVWNLLHFDILNLEVFFDLLGLLSSCCALALALLQNFKTCCHIWHLGESICQKLPSWRRSLIYRRGQGLVKQKSRRWGSER